MMKHYRYIFFLLLLAANVHAQVSSGPSDPPCATMEQDSKLRARFPALGTLEEFEQAIKGKVEEIQQLRKSGRTMAGLISLPVIVHVVHNGEAVGTGTNISQAQVQAQLDVLNEDFRKMVGTPGGSSSNPIAADIEIEFCLSPVDENGNALAQPGIHRYNGQRSDWSRDQIENQLKPTTIWNPNLFFNIWTVKFAAVDANLIGYAQFPDQTGLVGLPSAGPATTDGVVIRYQSFGSVDKGTFPVMVAPYNRGRTLTHETGHWLGLRHIWGDGPCADDFVSDTPPAQSPSSGCPIGRFSCSVTNMVENYMDYSDDACMNIFTEGQKTRMLAAIELSPRRKAVVQGNLCAPLVVDVPTPNFTTDNLLCVLLGSEVSFTDLSTQFPTEWYWEFEGGDPATDTVPNPKIHYNTPGSYDVLLTTRNSVGQSDTLIMEDYIVVSEEGICSDFSNFKPEFTSTVLDIAQFGNYTGYLTGHNSAGSKAFSEFFSNDCGYKYINGVAIQFANVSSISEEAKINITVWNARGAQNGPGSVIERKQVLVKQILEDIANNRPTTITFDRETPLFSRAYHVGVEIEYNEDYTLAIKSSANGEATDVTSWVKDASGQWELYGIAFGANIAMDIKPIVGIHLSVQVSASSLIVNPGQQVVLNGHGASIFQWSSSDGEVQNYTGPQLVARPTQTTTYITKGSGLELCYDTAYTTVYIREGVVGLEDELTEKQITVFPNPGSGSVSIQIDNNYTGSVEVNLHSMLGNVLEVSKTTKTGKIFTTTIPTHQLKSGMFLIQINMGGKQFLRKWVNK